jgi:hypothetical protein
MNAPGIAKEIASNKNRKQVTSDDYFFTTEFY